MYFTLGNWDDHAGSFGLQPDDPFLADTAALFFDDLLLGTTNRLAFEATLADVEASGKQAWLVMHTPPGGDRGPPDTGRRAGRVGQPAGAWVESPLQPEGATANERGRTRRGCARQEMLAAVHRGGCGHVGTCATNRPGGPGARWPRARIHA